jgi:hypothetical protein
MSLLAQAAVPPSATNSANAAITVAGCVKRFTALPFCSGSLSAGSPERCARPVKVKQTRERHNLRINDDAIGEDFWCGGFEEELAADDPIAVFSSSSDSCEVRQAAMSPSR